MRTQPTAAAVYRLYDETGLLLYVGCSINPRERITFHRWSKPWGKRVDRSRDEVTWFPTLEDAGFAEYEAITTESPLHNARAQRYGVPEESLRRIRRGGRPQRAPRCFSCGCEEEGTVSSGSIFRWCAAHAKELDLTKNRAVTPRA